MSWFNTSGFASLAKSALNHAQKTIDKALDIRQEGEDEPQPETNPAARPTPAAADDTDSFFAAFGLSGDEGGVSVSAPGKAAPGGPKCRDAPPGAEKAKIGAPMEQSTATLWGSFTGSFFDPSGALRVGRTERDDRGPAGMKSERPRTVSLGEHTTITVSKDGFLQSGRKLQTADSLPDFFSTESELKPISHEATEETETLEIAAEDIVARSTPLPSVDPSDIPKAVAEEAPHLVVGDRAEARSSAWDSGWGPDVSWSTVSTSIVAPSPLPADRSSATEGNTEPLSPPVDASQVEEASSKLGCTSFTSVSSSSTTGESSSTMDDSMGTASALSAEKDGRHSSTTLTPEMFSDSGESTFLPLGMSSSWDLGDGSGPVVKLQPPQQPRPASGEQVFEIGPGEHERAPHVTEANESATDSGDQATPYTQPHSDLVEHADRGSSLVSYMLEEAMTESVRSTLAVEGGGGTTGDAGETVRTSPTRAHSPHSTASSTSSTAERSDPVKTTESEQNSGHTSGDEIETTTSSDIEIISSPSAGGGNGDRCGSHSPVKPSCMWKSKQNSSNALGGFHPSSSSRHHHHGCTSIRSDSPASDTSSTKEGHPIQFGAFPVRPDLSLPHSAPSTGKGLRHERKLSEATSEDMEGNPVRVETLVKKLSELTTIVEAREAKVLELSRENVELREKNKTVKAQLQKTEERHAAETRDVSTLTKELTERLSSCEKKLQQALKDKDIMKRDLQQTTTEIASRVSLVQMEEIKKEKDAEIAELRQEGESLSKKVLQYSNNVKKLRAKEKETENHIKKQREKIEEQSRELERIRKAIDAKEEVEKNQIELIRQLTHTVQKQDKELTNAKSELEDAQEKQSSMKAALDTAYKELAELHRKNIESDSQAQEAALSAAMSAKEELRLSLEQARHESKLQQDSLILQIEDLRLSALRNEQQAAQREDALRQDIASLQQRLREAESKNEELNQNISSATRPLLRQIDNLQSTLNMQTSAWDRVERNLTDRLTEAQNQLAHSSEKERAITEKYAEMSSKVSSLESQISTLRQEKLKVITQLETVQMEMEVTKNSKEKEAAYMETVKHSYHEEANQLKRQQNVLEHQLEIEKTALEAEKRKTALLQEQLKEKEHRIAQLVSNTDVSRRNSPSPQSVSMRGSFSEHFQSSWYQDDVPEGGSLSSAPHSRMNVYESLRLGNPATLLDGLQSQLKLRDGDIIQLQNDIGHLEMVKESITQEMVKMTSQNEELEAELNTLRGQRDKFLEIEQKYNALLQMYGEKTEEAAELRLDLQDVKEMYKAQIDELLGRK